MESLATLFTKPQAVGLLALQLLAPMVWAWQRRPGALGGAISIIKALWLIYAVTLWFAVPILLWNQHWGFAALAVSMLIRGVVEIPLCATKRWKVAYGLTHDWIHLALCVFVVVDSQLNPQLLMICGLTAVSLISEIVFVGWFASKTAGPSEGVYFVPGGDEYRAINRRTAIIFLPQFVVFNTLLVLCLIR